MCGNNYFICFNIYDVIIVILLIFKICLDVVKCNI